MRQRPRRLVAATTRDPYGHREQQGESRTARSTAREGTCHRPRSARPSTRRHARPPASAACPGQPDTSWGRVRSTHVATVAPSARDRDRHPWARRSNTSGQSPTAVNFTVLTAPSTNGNHRDPYVTAAIPEREEQGPPRPCAGEVLRVLRKREEDPDRDRPGPAEAPGEEGRTHDGAPALRAPEARRASFARRRVAGPCWRRSVYEYGASGARAQGVASPSAYTRRVPIERPQYERGSQPGSSHTSDPRAEKSPARTFFP